MKRAESAKEKSGPRRTGGHDAYLAALPDDKRTALEKLCKAILAAAPRAEAGFSYSMPSFKLDGRALVCFAAFTNHCSFFPMSAAVIRAHAADLKAYETSKGTIRFPAGKPLPATLVKKLVKARLEEIEKRRRRK